MCFIVLLTFFYLNIQTAIFWSSCTTWRSIHYSYLFSSFWQNIKKPEKVTMATASFRIDKTRTKRAQTRALTGVEWRTASMFRGPEQIKKMTGKARFQSSDGVVLSNCCKWQIHGNSAQPKEKSNYWCLESLDERKVGVENKILRILYKRWKWDRKYESRRSCMTHRRREVTRFKGVRVKRKQKAFRPREC